MLSHSCWQHLHLTWQCGGDALGTGMGRITTQAAFLCFLKVVRSAQTTQARVDTLFKTEKKANKQVEAHPFAQRDIQQVLSVSC